MRQHVSQFGLSVVTGASSGTGAALARRLHAEGVELIVVGRDPDRTARVGAELGVPHLVADFSRLGDVRRLAADILARTPAVDILFANAGGATTSVALTEDGNEPNYQINALAPFLLETLLRPALGKRIVATSSRSHDAAVLAADSVTAQLDDPGRLSAHQRYARAKLAALLLHEELRRRHPDVPIVDVHPGLVATDFGRYLGRTGAVLKVLARPVLSSPWTAAGHLLRAATADLTGGAYFHRDRPGRPSQLLQDRRLSDAVWQDAVARLESSAVEGA
ncbi:short-chain dehydrogenase [Actinoplanes philippinensis]|uniref:Short-chain dehydrogenase n=1 Tax=Actinoplanes philippinensis TaxID=35752 RepID=A0A1I2G1D0_9ACTN|nr:SDR family NAD(P)-dependent oxidoreductase [Actinoplanes philippinensis]GIE76476.1 short-chain dehydrogenase [Actinoplanes philippinensis]SFF10770.1 Short-chain dehydrogenase [Actinoplanes philippinensis]